MDCNDCRSAALATRMLRRFGRRLGSLDGFAGSSFAVDVNIANAADVYDYQLDLTFNPGVLQASAVVEGTFLSGSGATFFIPGVIDNSGGGVAFNADTLLTAISGANGSGLLLVFDFSAIAPGTSALDVQNLILQDSLGNLIDGSVKNSSVTVKGPIGVPESPSLILLTLGLTVLMTIRLIKAAL